MAASARPKVVSTKFCPEMVIDRFLAEFTVVQGPTDAVWGKKEIMEVAPDAAAILSRGGAHERIDDELLRAMPDLKIVASASLGYDNLDVKALEAHGVWGTNEPHAFVAPTAEITVGLIISVLRRMAEGDRYVRAGRWRTYAPGSFDGEAVEGKTVGLVGFGRIGQAVARRLQGFDVRLLYYARNRRPAELEAALTTTYAPLDRLLAEADVVSIHVPLNQETRGLVDADCFARMKKGAFFINTSRGAVVDELALVQALERGHLAGAGLDVFAQEPQVPAALLRMENVVLLPHIGGATHQARLSSMLNAAENVWLVLNGYRPKTPVAIPPHPRQPLLHTS